MPAPYTLTLGNELCPELYVFERRPRYQRVYVADGVVIAWPGAKVKDPNPLGFRLDNGESVSKERVDSLTRSTASSDLRILYNPRADGGEAEIAFTVLGNTSEPARRKLPNAIVDAVRSGSGWLIGCRDGCLYSFTRSGSLRWTWTTPGTSPEIPPYQRPQPYHLLGHEDGALVASWGQVWLVDSDGQTRWNLDLSKELPSTTILVGRRELVDVETGHSAVVDEGFDVRFSISPSIVSGLDMMTSASLF